VWAEASDVHVIVAVVDVVVAGGADVMLTDAECAPNANLGRRVRTSAATTST
jgi:hypothetical protein